MFEINQIENTKIFEIENFLSPFECTKIVNWFKDQPKTKFDDNPYWSNRTINYSRINDTEIKKLIESNRIDRTLMIRMLFDTDYYPDYTDLVYWNDGLNMDSHCDNLNHFYYRKVSTVLYLNDSYKGGETFFTNQNVQIVPKIGKLVAYPSSGDYSHGVNRVEGDRYTFPMWFTDSIQHIEV